MPRKKIQETKTTQSEEISNGGSDNVMDEINHQLTEADEYVAKKAIKRGDNSTIDSSEIPDLLTDEIIDNEDDEDFDPEAVEQIDAEAKKSFLENEVFDAIVKFMKTDDLIKEKENELREMIAPLKKQRSSLETFLIDYLEQIDQEFIKIGEKTQLTKVETESKGAIKPENVAEALLEGFKKHELYTDEQHDEMVKVIKDMMAIVESKREKKVKKKIARVDLEKEAKKQAAKEAKQKKQDEIANVNDNEEKIGKMEKVAKKASPKAAKSTKSAAKSPGPVKSQPKAQKTQKVTKARK